MRLSALALLLACGAAQASGYALHPRAPLLLETLKARYGFAPEELISVSEALLAAQRLPQLVEAEQKAPEKTESWTRYSARINADRIAGGRALLDAQTDTLAQAEEEFGVPPPVVAAILGIETRYGSITGKTRVLDALATQGFDHPTRSAFFFSELTEYFAFCRDSKRAPTDPAGSYAGAMGAAQFMPSNYRRLALDYDGDGRTDLWSLPDAIGSIAHYFTRYRPALAWQRGAPLILPASIEGKLPTDLVRNVKAPSHTVAQLAALGITTDTPLPPETPVGLIELTLEDGRFEYWLGLHNFYSVMTYNPRTYYAMAVSQLALRLAEPAP